MMASHIYFQWVFSENTQLLEHTQRGLIEHSPHFRSVPLAAGRPFLIVNQVQKVIKISNYVFYSWSRNWRQVGLCWKSKTGILKNSHTTESSYIGPVQTSIIQIILSKVKINGSSSRLIKQSLQYACLLPDIWTQRTIHDKALYIYICFSSKLYSEVWI